MSWGRVALVYAAQQNEEALEKVAAVLKYSKQTTLNILDDVDAEIITGASSETLTKTNELKRAPVPPAVFLNAIYKETHPSQVIETEDYLDSAVTNLPESIGNFRFPLSQALLNFSHFSPLFLNTLGRSGCSRRLNHRKILHRLARAETLQKVPYLRKKRWPQRLQILVDPSDHLQPYWEDFANLIQQLKKILGKKQVEAVQILEGDFLKKRPDCIDWPPQVDGDYRGWKLPLPDVPILVLSDFGVMGTGELQEQHWSLFARRLYNHEAPILSLSPAGASPKSAEICRKLHPIPWNDRHPPRRIASTRGFKLSTEKASLDKLLAMVSAFPLVDSALLRLLRKAMQLPGSELEGLLWNHVAMQTAPLGKCMHPREAVQWQKAQQNLDSSLRESGWKALQNHHKNTPAEFRLLESVNQHLMNGEALTATERIFWQNLIAVQHQQSERTDLLNIFNRTFLTLLPRRLNDGPIADLVSDMAGVTCRHDIRQEKVPDFLPSGIDVRRWERLFTSQERQEIVIWRIHPCGPRGEFYLYRDDEPLPEGLLNPIEEIRAIRSPPLQITFTHAEGNLKIYHSVKVMPVQASIEHLNSIKRNELHALQIRTEGNSAIQVTLDSTREQLQLECLSRPGWAEKVWMKKSPPIVADLDETVNSSAKVTIEVNEEDDQLHASFWMAEKEHMLFRSGLLSSQSGRWEGDAYSGEDKFGFYFNLDVEHGITQRFRWIEPGSFLMGSPETEKERRQSEIQHQVTLSKGFWLADTTVTQGFWKAIMGKNPSRFSDNLENPVESISWHDARKFIEKLNSKIPGINACLPTEAQWEYACRAGTTTPFSLGENITPEQVNYDGSMPYANGEKGLDRGKTVSVKTLPSNAWGLYEMHGNVWEWCNDWFGEYTVEPVTDPEGAIAGEGRVIRGGSWINNGRNVRSAIRLRDTPARRLNGIGFRLALGHSSSGQDRSKPAADTSSSVAEQRQHGSEDGLRGIMRKLFKTKK